MLELKIDKLGRVVIPKAVRVSLGMQLGSLIEMVVSGDSIILRKAGGACRICGKEINFPSDSELHVCDECVSKILIQMVKQKVIYESA